MAIKVKDGVFKCFYCNEEYKTEREADECVLKHNLIYVPMTSEEINHLIRYIYEQQSPPIALIGRLKKIMKSKAGKSH